MTLKTLKSQCLCVSAFTVSVFVSVFVLVFVLVNVNVAYAQKTKTALKQKTTARTKGKKVQTATPAIDYSQETIQKVFVLDSLVCPDSSMVKNIPLPRHAGVLTLCSDGTTVYENDYGDMRLFAEKDTANHYRLFHQEFIGNDWSTPQLLNIDATLTDLRNPFLLADGQTLYFSGRDATKPNKKYHIFTSTLDTETGQFKKPMALPLPFFCGNDDVLYVSDDADSVAWLVSRRGMTPGNVCIYTIHLSPSVENYDNDEVPEGKLVSLATLSSISDTWPSAEVRDAQLKAIQANLSSYTETADNKKVTANTKSNAKAELQRKIDEYRRLYHNSKPAARKKLETTILDLETKAANLHTSH